MWSLTGRSMRALLWFVGLAAFGLAGCAETDLAVHTVKSVSDAMPPPKVESSYGPYKLGKAYEVDGIWYHPAADPHYDEVGIASWYGKDFHGKPTANGATYDMNALTAAHKTLPMPSRVRVTNLDNGRSLVLVVNDRGPFVNGRIIDVSRRSAQLLGFEGRGLATVRVQMISEENQLYVAQKPDTSEEERTAPEAAPRVSVAVGAIDAPDGVQAAAVRTQPEVQPASGAPVLFIQAGAFSHPDNANRLSGKLARFGPVRITNIQRNGQFLYRVRVGPLASIETADNVLQNMIRAGHREARLVVE